MSRNALRASCQQSALSFQLLNHCNEHAKGTQGTYIPKAAQVEMRTMREDSHAEAQVAARVL
jgi:hypothetical protein